MSNREELQQLLDLQNEHLSLSAEWLKHMLTLAVGALAVLSGLRPEVVSSIQAYLLSGTWVSLGLGIVFGAGATFLQVHHTRRLAAQFRAEMIRSLKEGRSSIGEPVIAKPSIIFSLAPPAMVICLLLAVLCLVTFSVAAALGL